MRFKNLFIAYFAASLVACQAETEVTTAKKSLPVDCGVTKAASLTGDPLSSDPIKVVKFAPPDPIWGALTLDKESTGSPTLTEISLIYFSTNDGIVPTPPIPEPAPKTDPTQYGKDKPPVQPGGGDCGRVARVAGAAEKPATAQGAGLLDSGVIMEPTGPGEIEQRYNLTLMMRSAKSDASNSGLPGVKTRQRVCAVYWSVNTLEQLPKKDLTINLGQISVGPTYSCSEQFLNDAGSVVSVRNFVEAWKGSLVFKELNLNQSGVFTVAFDLIGSIYISATPPAGQSLRVKGTGTGTTATAVIRSE